MPGPNEFLAQESYQALARITSREAIVFVGTVVQYGLMSVPLMYIYLAWIIITYPYRRY